MWKKFQNIAIIIGILTGLSSMVWASSDFVYSHIVKKLDERYLIIEHLEMRFVQIDRAFIKRDMRDIKNDIRELKKKLDFDPNNEFIKNRIRELEDDLEELNIDLQEIYQQLQKSKTGV